jgi:hypothetical protein
MTREELQAWLDRRPGRVVDEHGDWCQRENWRDWFTNDPDLAGVVTYLGQRSARTGPDVVPAVQRCECRQCRPSEEENSNV